MTGRAPDATPHESVWGLRRVARFPGLRALTWSGNLLYASRDYDLICAMITPGQVVSNELSWRSVARFHPAWWRHISACSRLSSRLFRDGFHALAVLDSSTLVAAVPGAIITLSANEKQFRITHRITRGTRPLHITAVPGGPVLWGEYFDNVARDEVHIYASTDAGANWNVAYTFSRGEIRHVHNIVHDPWRNCLWILTGDYGDECRILRASCDLSQIDVVLQGNQQARAVALFPADDGVYFSSDTPLEANFIFHLDRRGTLSKLSPINGSSIFGCRAANGVFFSTMVEPSAINTDREVHIYGSCDGNSWNSLLSWRKDRWPMHLFQYGNAFLPDGNNTTEFLAISTIAVEADDLVTSFYSISSGK
ncbi:MAG TPA: hypothetical protein VIH89_18170 [Candidatus Sulfotelmatobacter sp.]